MQLLYTRTLLVSAVGAEMHVTHGLTLSRRHPDCPVQGRKQCLACSSTTVTDLRWACCCAKPPPSIVGLQIQLSLQPTQQQRMLSLLRAVRDRHVSMAQRASSAAAEDLTRRVLLEALGPLQAAQLLLGAAPGVLEVWEVLVLMEGRCSTSRQVTTCS